MEKIIYTTTAVNVDALNGKSFIEGNGDKNWEVEISSPLSEKKEPILSNYLHWLMLLV